MSSRPRHHHRMTNYALQMQTQRVKDAYEFINNIRDQIDAGDIFTTRGHYGDTIVYHVKALFVSGEEGNSKYPHGTPMVQYFREHPDNVERSCMTCYPIRKFLFTKSTTHYRVRAVRPLKELTL